MENKDLKVGDFVYCVSTLDNTFNAGVITDITTEINKAYQKFFCRRCLLDCVSCAT